MERRTLLAGGSKLLPEWGIPARVWTMTHQGKRAVVVDIVKGRFTEVPVKRCRKVQGPTDHYGLAVWNAIMTRQVAEFRHSNPATRKRRRLLTTAEA